MHRVALRRRGPSRFGVRTSWKTGRQRHRRSPPLSVAQKLKVRGGLQRQFLGEPSNRAEREKHYTSAYVQSKREHPILFSGIYTHSVRCVRLPAVAAVGAVSAFGREDH